MAEWSAPLPGPAKVKDAGHVQAHNELTDAIREVRAVVDAGPSDEALAGKLTAPGDVNSALTGAISKSLTVQYAPRAPQKLVLSGDVTAQWGPGTSVGGSTELASALALTSKVAPKRVSNGASGTSRLEATLSPAIDASDSHVLITLNLTGRANLKTFSVYAGDAALGNHYRWDLLFSVDALTTLGTEGGWVTFSLDPEKASAVQGTPDRASLAKVRVTLADNGTGTVTHAIDRISLSPRAQRGTYLLSLDDGFASQWDVVKYAAKYGVRGTLYVIADLVGKSGYLSLAQLKAAQGEYGWEVAAHAFTVNAHNNRLTSLTAAELDIELRSLKQWLVSNGFNGSDNFCYPAGIYDAATVAVVQRYFSSARTTYKMTNSPAYPTDPHLRPAQSLNAAITLAEAKSHIDSIGLSRAVLEHYGHDFGDNASAIKWKYADMFALIEYAAASGVRTIPSGEWMTRPV